MQKQSERDSRRVDKPTPGPWHVNRISDQAYVEHEAKVDGEMVFIADLQRSDSNESDWPEIDANARLIAAAPELLSAIVELLDACPTSCEDRRLMDAQRAAEAAIAKAEGKDRR